MESRNNLKTCLLKKRLIELRRGESCAGRLKQNIIKKFLKIEKNNIIVTVLIMVLLYIQTIILTYAQKYSQKIDPYVIQPHSKASDQHRIRCLFFGLV